MVIILFLIISTIIVGLGLAGRGAWSRTISGISSTLTLVLIGYQFITLGLIKGLFLLVLVFVVLRVSELFFRKAFKTNEKPSLYDIDEENRIAQKYLESLKKKTKK